MDTLNSFDERLIRPTLFYLMFYKAIEFVGNSYKSDKTKVYQTVPIGLKDQ